MSEEKKSTEIAPQRLAILEKIKEYEAIGDFEHDLEDDPPTKPLEAKDIDYLRKNIKNKIKSHIVNKLADKTIDQLIDAKQIIIKNVIGAENLQGITGPSFITSNHFHIFENMAIYKVFKDNQPNKHKFYRVIREGNYTNPPKGFDQFFKHANTLPLSRSTDTMKKFLNALEVLTQKKSYILVYPEQYMWWNYKKPRPFKDGVFRFATKFNTPIIPCFITMSDSSILDSDGLPIQEYTVHIFKPLYPDPNLNVKENVKNLKEQNFNLWKETYEKVYGKKLTYTYEER